MRTFLCGMYVKGKLQCFILVLVMQPYKPTNSIKFTMFISPQLTHTFTSNFL